MRRRFLTEAVNDEVLFWHSLAARLANNVQALSALANEFLVAPVARERALAATLLGYFGDEEALRKLQELSEKDVSWWVRDQAAWGWEVCSAEQACQARYAEALNSGTLEGLVAGLAEIQPGLTPLAWAWKRDIEAAAWTQTKDPRIHGYVELFWYHWSSVSSHQKDIEIMGRKLPSYCRGEWLKNGVANWQAHWWDIDD